MLDALDDIAKKYRIYLLVYGRVADGNLHPQILGTRKEDVEKIKREIYDKTRSLGGAIRGNME